jgi:phosphatidylglycerophosphatase A
MAQWLRPPPKKSEHRLTTSPEETRLPIAASTAELARPLLPALVAPKRSFRRKADADDAHPPARADHRVSAGFMLRHPAHVLALGFGSGLSPWAPGTVGTLWAWAAFAVGSIWLTPTHWAWVIGLGSLVGWWASRVTARNLGIHDPGAIVVDEVLAFWLVLLVLTPAGFVAQAVAFLLFRFFDAAKPGPVSWADQTFKGPGWRGAFGILFDDYVAAACTLLVLALGQHLFLTQISH